jgi:LPS-assembly protein
MDADMQWRQSVASPPAAAASAAQAASGAASDATSTDPVQLRRSYQMGLPTRDSRRDKSAPLPIFVDADKLTGESGVRTTAEGSARMRRGTMTIRADKLEHTDADNTAHAVGNVRVDNLGNSYAGPQAQLQLDTNAGWFISPTYRFARTGAGGHAERFDFIDDQHANATKASYTSCTPEDGAGPAWELTTSKVELDFENEVGRAEGAVVRFYGVPILAAPVMTFPLSEKRKSGWLPPNFDISNRSGFEFELPYYWNIAPNYDATLTPTFATRRGAGLRTEFRYLEPNLSGVLNADLLPNDREAEKDRWLTRLQHQQNFDTRTWVKLDIQRTSDDDYWKDFPRAISGITPRLLSSQAAFEHRFDPGSLGMPGLGVQDLQAFARVQEWQALQTTDTSTRFVSPYRRAPQVGVAGSGDASGLQWSLDTQVNRFTHPGNENAIEGTRFHALTSIAYPINPVPGAIGWTITPRLNLNAASYALDEASTNGRKSMSRVIPTFSLNSVWVLERPGRWFGRDYIETLEPRLQYLKTPYRDQSAIPQFDSAPLDFNADSIYADNAFSGIDRVADAHQVAAGVTARLIDPTTGAEALRLGIVQRYLLSDQRITADGEPLTQKLSDLLLLGSTSVIPHWYLDSTLRWNADAHRVERTTFTTRYTPGAWRTVALTFRETRGLNRQVDIGWQWPFAGRMPSMTAPAAAPAAAVAAAANAESGMRSGAGGCASGGGTWYTVGRVNYNLLDNRITDSLFGIEYDGGCWIGRVVAERLSTGQAEATTRLMFQLELVGLSRLGSSPLRALRDNIPGYRLLREENALIASPANPEPFTSAND